MRRYAENTKTPVLYTRNEIERTLERYGANQFLYGYELGRAVVGFRMNERQVKISINLPKGDSDKDQKEVRRLWRSLVMIIKAKLEAVASGVAVFDDEFMPYIVLPSGETVGQFMRPQIVLAYKDGTLPKLLPPPS